MGALTAQVIDLICTMIAVNDTAQVIQFEMASKAVNYADLSQVVADPHEQTDRVDELENA